jgi:G:T/U-mismatch repair DNA glycosylase
MTRARQHLERPVIAALSALVTFLASTAHYVTYCRIPKWEVMQLKSKQKQFSQRNFWNDLKQRDGQVRLTFGAAVVMITMMMTTT